MVLEQLLRDPPALHTDRAGRTIDYGASPELLRFLAEAARPGMRTVETGAGHSTIVFAASGCEHHCVVPDASLVDRIEAWCGANDVSFDAVERHIGISEEVLPALAVADVDLALVDGRHAFPTPFLDWYYLAARLRVGGTMIVDDIQLWTGRVLRQFLLEESSWKLVSDQWPRTAVFEKLDGDSHGRNWLEQPFTRQRSERIGRFRRLEKWWRRLRGLPT